MPEVESKAPEKTEPVAPAKKKSIFEIAAFAWLALLGATLALTVYYLPSKNGWLGREMSGGVRPALIVAIAAGIGALVVLRKLFADRIGWHKPAQGTWARAVAYTGTISLGLFAGVSLYRYMFREVGDESRWMEVVLQLSLPETSDPARLIALGQALAPLRSEDVLLVGTGGIVHNLARIEMDTADDVAEPWAAEFDRWVADRTAALDTAALSGYRPVAPYAAEAVPTSEHYDPLLVTMGTALVNDSVMDIYTGFRHGTLSLRSFALVGRRREDRGF